MTVVVSPSEFRFVSYDAAVIERVVTGLAAALGLTDLEITLDVDETTPLARVRVDIGDTIAVRAESGALEDTRKPRHMSETAMANSIGRVLLRVRDRLHGGFGEAPADDDLSLSQMAAWEAYCSGRLERIGITVNQQRWRYNFRNRHGFTDHADAVFDQIWSSDGLGWGELDELSRQAAVGSPAPS
jgi:hypothetical protein